MRPLIFGPYCIYETYLVEKSIEQLLYYYIMNFSQERKENMLVWIFVYTYILA